MRRCDLRNLQLVTYENGIGLQSTLVEMRQQEQIDDQLLLLEHPPVITLGRGGKMENLLATPQALAASGVRFFETTRGGDITYHGPGQLVGYPIIHLGEGRRDVRKYVSILEELRAMRRTGSSCRSGRARLLTEYQADRIEAGKTFGLIIGNYRVLDRLGAGGMGVVFKAEHLYMRRQVAIKVLSSSSAQTPRVIQRISSFEMRLSPVSNIRISSRPWTREMPKA